MLGYRAFLDQPISNDWEECSALSCPVALIWEAPVLDLQLSGSSRNFRDKPLHQNHFVIAMVDRHKGP